MLIKILTSKQYKALQEENQRLKEENAELIERAAWNAREQRKHNENMRNEIAKLKAELKETESRDQVVVERLRWKNEKLRGSLINLRFGYAYAMRRLFSGTNPEKYEFWRELQTKFKIDRKAYRKAKEFE